MIVYRVEKRGKGPYTSNAIRNLGYTPANTMKHPIPEDDGINFKPWSDEHCGFKSIEDLQAWFDCPTMREKLHNVKFYVVVMRVADKHVKIGRKQIVFNRKRARIINKISLIEV